MCGWHLSQFSVCLLSNNLVNLHIVTEFGNFQGRDDTNMNVIQRFPNFLACDPLKRIRVHSSRVRYEYGLHSSRLKGD